MATVIYALIALLVFAVPAAAQTTRVEAIAEEQAEKAKAVGPEGPSDAERIIRRVLLSPLLSGGEGLYPWFGSVFGGTGMGARRRLPEALRERVALQPADRHLDQQFDGAARRLRGAGAVARQDAVRDQRPMARCARRVVLWLRPGLGARGRASASTSRRRTSAPASPSGRMRFVSVTGGYSFMNFDTAARRADLRRRRSARHGRRAELQHHRAARWRSTGEPRRATARAAASIAPRSSATRRPRSLPYSFSSQEYEVVQLVPLVREQFVLAARGLMTLTTPDAGDAVPVMLAPYLGSGSTLRGYSQPPLHRSQSRAADRRVPLAAVALSRHGAVPRRRTGRGRPP